MISRPTQSVFFSTELYSVYVLEQSHFNHTSDSNFVKIHLRNDLCVEWDV